MAPDGDNQALDSDPDLLIRLFKEYPEIDSTLVMMFLEELPDRSDESLDALTAQLGELALQARFDKFQNDGFDEDDYPPSSCFSDSVFRDGTTASSSVSSALSVGPALEFLRAAFPDVAVSVLHSVLDQTGCLIEDLDMESIVHEVLTMEAIREMQERGFEDDVGQSPVSPQRDWSTVEKKKTKKKKGRSTSVSTTPAQPGVTIALSDIRQRQNRPGPSQVGIPKINTSLSNDPWTRLNSLASHLSTLLQPLPESHFLSLFHNPKFGTPAKAMRQELGRIGNALDPKVDYTTELVQLVELLGCSTESQVSDARICLHAVGGDLEAAWDLVQLLNDMDGEGPIVIHSPSVSTSQIHSPTWSVIAKASLPSSPSAPLRSINTTRTAVSSPPTSPSNQWIEVTRRRKKDEVEIDPLAQFIPAYRNMPAGWRQQSGRSADEPDLVDDGAEVSEEDCRYWAAHYRAKHHEALKQASKFWRRGGGGGAGGRTGDVAFHYAEEARELDRKSRKWAMKAARAMVQSRQKKTLDRYTVDLHGLTISEALTLVHETVDDWWHAPASATARKPLTIVTGQGNHSKNQVGVIGPAVQKDLESNGWRISRRPGAITVIGSRRT